jgi:hypothetical protein
MSQIKYVNTCDHPIDFKDPNTGTSFSVGRSNWVVNALPVIVVVGVKEKITHVNYRFLPNEEGLSALTEIESRWPDAVIVGSVLAAQAYPKRVMGLVDSSYIMDKWGKDPFFFNIFEDQVPRCAYCNDLLTEENVARDEMGYPRRFVHVLWCDRCGRDNLFSTAC